MPTRNAHACAGESGGSAVSIRYWAKSRWSLNFKWIPSLKRALCAERGEFDGRRTENRSLLYHILIFIKIEAPKLLNIGQFSVFFWKTGARGFKSLCYNKNTAVHTDGGIVAEKEGFEPSRRYSRPTPLAGAPLRPLEYFSKPYTKVKYSLGGERGIRTPGAFRHHWFSRPAP